MILSRAAQLGQHDDVGDVDEPLDEYAVELDAIAQLADTGPSISSDVLA